MLSEILRAAKNPGFFNKAQPTQFFGVILGLIDFWLGLLGFLGFIRN